MKKQLLVVVVAVMMGILMLSPNTTNALLFEYNYEFSEGESPSGDAPWLTAEFIDNVDGTVTLTMSTSGLSTGEFVDAGSNNDGGWLFNFTGNLSNLDIIFSSGNDANVVLTSSNAFKADGDGLFDIRFAWVNTDRFLPNETSVYTLSSTEDGFNSEWFNEYSSPDGTSGGKGPFLSAVHVQGIDNLNDPSNEGSGWVAPVPDASVMLLLGSSFLGLAVFSRKRKKS